MMNRLKAMISLIIIGLLIIPAVQKTTKLIRVQPLKGYYKSVTKPVFSWSSWMNGVFQEQYCLFMEIPDGARSHLTRLYNQLDYSFFSVPHAQKIVAGKNGCLFAEPSIQAYLGHDFVGKYYIDQKVQRTRFLQDFLWHEKGILLIVVFAPGKAYFYPEFIPSRYMKEKRGFTNYDYYRQECISQGVNHIDFNRWLILMRNYSPYVLYPKAGIHWSSYGACLCADSLRKYLEVKLNRTLPRMIIDSVVVPKKAQDEDNDIIQTMNLLWSTSEKRMAYLRFHFTSNYSMPRPRALFVGDSFYWTWDKSGFVRNTFSSPAFWYYNEEVYPEHLKSPTNTGNIDFPGTILKNDVIILIQTNSGYGDLGSGWVDRAWDYFYPGPSKEKEIEAGLHANPGMMKMMEKKAKERGVTTEAMIRMDAIFSVNQQLLKFRKIRNP